MLPSAAFALFASGCTHLAPTPAPTPESAVRVVDTACSWVRLITISPADTPETKRQVLAHDQAVLTNCPRPSK
ncbi:MAG: hypothetical protein B7Z23_12085, partial [Pseudomonadales bacterium 32-61-5]